MRWPHAADANPPDFHELTSSALIRVIRVIRVLLSSVMKAAFGRLSRLLGITDVYLHAEEEALEALNAWVEAKGLPPGFSVSAAEHEIAFDFADPESGVQKAVFDLAWPNGIQEELSQPVAVLLDERAETIGVV